MIESDILNEVASLASLPTPTVLKQIDPMLRNVCKNSTSSVWNSMQAGTAEYMNTVVQAIKSMQPIVLPPDLREVQAKAKNKPSQSLIDELEEFDCKSFSKQITVRGLLEMRDSGVLRIPSFQRNYIWSPKAQKRFIKNTLKGIPILSILMTIDQDDEKRQLLDGVQRTETLHRFFNNQFSVQKTKFSDLPEKYKNRFLTADVPIVECRVDKNNWPEIFQEVNLGGSQVVDIEIWRAIFKHPMLDLLEDMSINHDIWSEIFKLKDKRFKGMYLLLRAVAMSTTYLNYQKPMTKFLVGYCRDLELYPDSIDATQIWKDLDRILKGLRAHGKEIFKTEPTGQLNNGVFDCLIHAGLTAIRMYPGCTEKDLQVWLSEVKTRLMDDPAIKDSLKDNTSGNDKVILRMTRAEEIIRDLVNNKLNNIRG